MIKTKTTYQTSKNDKISFFNEETPIDELPRETVVKLKNNMDRLFSGLLDDPDSAAFVSDYTQHFNDIYDILGDYHALLEQKVDCEVASEDNAKSELSNIRNQRKEEYFERFATLDEKAKDLECEDQVESLYDFYGRKSAKRKARRAKWNRSINSPVSHQPARAEEGHV